MWKKNWNEVIKTFIVGILYFYGIHIFPIFVFEGRWFRPRIWHSTFGQYLKIQNVSVCNNIIIISAYVRRRLWNNNGLLKRVVRQGKTGCLKNFGSSLSLLHLEMNDAAIITEKQTDRRPSLLVVQLIKASSSSCSQI